jgi:hypothetical protein
MAIGVMRFNPLSMAQASPGYFGLQNLQQGLMQGLKMQQMAEQQKLAEQKAAQEAQLMPLQQQLLEAKTRDYLAQASMRPMQQAGVVGGRELKQSLDILKQLQDDPSLLDVPGMAEKADEARRNVAAHQFPMDQATQIPTQVAPVSEKVTDEFKLTPNQKLQYQFEQKNVPATQKLQQVRSTSAKLLLGQLRQSMEMLKDFYGPGQSLKAAVRSYSAKYGLGEDAEANLYNTVVKLALEQLKLEKKSAI